MLFFNVSLNFKTCFKKKYTRQQYTIYSLPYMYGRCLLKLAAKLLSAGNKNRGQGGQVTTVCGTTDYANWHQAHHYVGKY